MTREQLEELHDELCAELDDETFGVLVFIAERLRVERRTHVSDSGTATQEAAG